MRCIIFQRRHQVFCCAFLPSFPRIACQSSDLWETHANGDKHTASYAGNVCGKKMYITTKTLVWNDFHSLKKHIKIKVKSLKVFSEKDGGSALWQHKINQEITLHYQAMHFFQVGRYDCPDNGNTHVRLKSSALSRDNTTIDTVESALSHCT